MDFPEEDIDFLQDSALRIKIEEFLAEMKDMRVLEGEISIKSAMTTADAEALDALVDLIVAA